MLRYFAEDQFNAVEVSHVIDRVGFAHTSSSTAVLPCVTPSGKIYVGWKHCHRVMPGLEKLRAMGVHFNRSQLAALEAHASNSMISKLAGNAWSDVQSATAFFAAHGVLAQINAAMCGKPLVFPLDGMTATEPSRRTRRRVTAASFA